MARYKFAAIKTSYWKPGENYIEKILMAIKEKVQDWDILVISEKAISTATGNIEDESLVKADFTANLLAKYWMRIVWAYILGPLCHLRKETLDHFKKYPSEEGGAHKQLVLRHTGFLQALRHSSEGGIDGSNLPYSYVSLPLIDAENMANYVCRSVRSKLDKKIVVMIVDSDRTYSWRNFHITPVTRPIKGITSVGGCISYILGRSLKLKKRATPLAIAGAELDTNTTLEIAELANRARGFGAGKTIWEMASSFGVSLTNVSWEMLEKADHRPIVMIRSNYRFMKNHSSSKKQNPNNETD